MRKPLLNVASALALLFWLSHAGAESIPTPEDVRVAIGRLGAVPVPADNPLTAAKVALGKRLFQDPRLSGDASRSCESCHLPSQGFAVATPLGPAYPTQAERRNSPTLISVAYNEPLIWDGRAPNLDKQALGPVKNILHQNHNIDLLVEQLKTDEDYTQAFQAAYGDRTVTAKRIAQALSSYERTLVFDESPLDRYMDGDRSALEASAQRGLALFMGKARCIVCHTGANLTDNGFHNLAVPDDHVTGDAKVMASVRFDAKRIGMKNWAELTEDPGREGITKDPADRGKFRTMGLRNIAQSPPYMHNGALETLEDVVAFYNEGGGDHPNKSPLMRPLGLTDDEQADLVAFLNALTGSQRAMNLK